MLDRLLVDVLIALEMYGFSHEMLNEETFGLVPARSPLKQRHALTLWFYGCALEGDGLDLLEI